MKVCRTRQEDRESRPKRGCAEHGRKTENHDQNEGVPNTAGRPRITTKTKVCRTRQEDRESRCDTERVFRGERLDTERVFSGERLDTERVFSGERLYTLLSLNT